MLSERAESAVAADVNWNQHIIPLKTLVYCTVCCILPPINQACVESYNRQSSTEGVVCSSGMTSMAQNLRRLPTHSEQVVTRFIELLFYIYFEIWSFIHTKVKIYTYKKMGRLHTGIIIHYLYFIFFQ